MKVLFSYLGILLFLFASCTKKPNYPSEPVIAYKDFIRYGNSANPDSVELVVSFTDNEGDVGLTQDDVQGIFSIGNIFMDYYLWDTTGTDHWAPYDDPFVSGVDTFRIGYRVPPVLPDGDPAEPVKGTIYVKQTTFIPPTTPIKFVVYMYDKAMHKSDTIHTPALIF